ncbi:hypothetical protein QJS10_CPB18g02079 [Acorus calamus]|uniref:Uncharacterized protein n=1 Tax=Acorus calamus TaxID=4465 RepID=A0AAV9CML3_ACOCL|nr:hypothetical protein QJS10_CPB18g02079 [Acorus calamus]
MTEQNVHHHAESDTALEVEASVEEESRKIIVRDIIETSESFNDSSQLKDCVMNVQTTTDQNACLICKLGGKLLWVTLLYVAICN